MAAVAKFQFSNTGIPSWIKKTQASLDTGRTSPAVKSEEERMFSQAMKPTTQRMFLENQKSLVDIGFQVTGNHRMEAKMKNQKFPSASNKTPENPWTKN